jgi:hypothetical protein
VRPHCAMRHAPRYAPRHGLLEQVSTACRSRRLSSLRGRNPASAARVAVSELDAASELDRQPAACSLAVIELNAVSGLGTVTPAASSIDLDQTVTNIAPCKCPAPVSDLVLSQDDVGIDSISVEEQVASSARFAPEGVREQSSRRTPRSGQEPT